MIPELELAFRKLQKALTALEIMLVKPIDPDRANIDASIQRFEFCIELYWKLLKRILEVKGQLVTYPKDILQEAYRGQLLDDEEMWLAMLKDRNQTSHTYDEELADQVYCRVKIYFPIMKKTFEKLWLINNPL